MFTGIIRHKGSVVSITPHGDWRIAIRSDLPPSALALGASVACAGICLTVAEVTGQFFTVTVSAETISKTNVSAWKAGRVLNLEPALRLGDPLDGHWVSGHVDGVIRVAERQPEGDSLRLRFDVPPALMGFVAPKGSVAVDGVSLTVNEVRDDAFEVNIIPHTQQWTSLPQLSVGDTANLEVDLLARYVAQQIKMKERR